MERGHYFCVAADGKRCEHRHYELSRPLARCQVRMGGSVWYSDDTGNVRPARRDELAELAEIVPRERGRPATGTGRSAPKVAISHEAHAIATEVARERGVSLVAVVDEAVRGLRTIARRKAKGDDRP